MNDRLKIFSIIGLFLFVGIMVLLFSATNEIFNTMSGKNILIASLAGLALFGAIMALIFKSSNSLPEKIGTVYPYNPKDPTEGGKFPNPNDPARPIVPLPPGKGGGSIFPVNPIRIIPSPRDSIRQIVSDRLNVLLEKDGPETGVNFMSEFKKLYPSPDYSFIYFDTLSYRLQMVVPEDKRDYLKDNLNSQMPDFNFLLFDEEVFGMHVMPSDPGFNDKKIRWYFEAINAYEAWNITKGSKNVIVAVVDNGFDLNHPEFTDKIVRPINIPERNNHIFPIVAKEHGTHVAATIVGNMNNGEGVCGIAPDCMFMPIQVATADGLMTTTSIFDGLLYAIYNGASVVNISLGPVPPKWFSALSDMEQLKYISADDQRQSEVWSKIYEIAGKNKCVIVTSAGNENIVSGYASKHRDDNVIVVSAVDNNLKKAQFSNYGNFSNIATNYSTVSAPGVNIYNAIFNGKYTFMSGTSMASPIVAGAVALMKSINPDLTVDEVKTILQDTGMKISDPVGPFIQLDKALVRVENNLKN